MAKRIAIVMGSSSDFEKVKPAIEVLEKFGVEYSVRVLSAHRTPDEAHEFAANAAANGFGAIIAVAGKAAHLGGVLAAATALPVVALPVSTSFLDGLDSVLSILPMPSGVPVAVVGVNAGANAALFCVRMLAVYDGALASKYAEYTEEMRKKTLADDAKIQAAVSGEKAKNK
ncbi:MAG: 5-(carboxyamino)imidazole ribonucleotide mutase [Roseburia sp.]|nr:5-(carboxyamino)imidazole ribonucleotide mutase [Roseburia sp.]